MDKLINKFIEEPVSVTSVADGWIFKFNLETLEELVKQAEDSGSAIVFVKSPTIQGN